MLLILSASNVRSMAAQEGATNTDALVDAILTELSPAERIGQLFLVSFKGPNVAAGSDIAELVQKYRVGGVVISAKNENFINDQLTI